MKRAFGIIILMLLCFTLSSVNVHSADYDYLYSLLYHGIDGRFDLKVDTLRLPYEEYKTFSLQVQDELSDLAARYSGKINEDVKEQTLVFKEKSEEKIKIKLLPGVLLNADYQENMEESRLLKNTNVSLLYQISNFARIRAEYGRLEREWWDVKEIKLVEDPDSDEETIDNENTHEEAVYNEEKEEKSRLGISLQTNERLTLSADIIGKGLDTDTDFTTVFGVEYKDKIGQVKYEYQIDLGEEKKTISGFELGFKDLATFNASYKLLNPDELKDRLQETTWDFGLDVNLNDLSSISIGYQLISNEEYNEEMELDNQEQESNIQAKLEYKF